MLFFTSVFMCLSPIAYTIGSQKLILKIEYNARTDKQTTVNNINITFINKTAAKYPRGGYAMVPENSLKNSYDKRLARFNKNFENSIDSNTIIPFNGNEMRIPVSFHTNPPEHFIRKINMDDEIKTNIYDVNPIPVIQNKGDDNKIKQHLDVFAMIRKKTYISTPTFNFPIAQFNKPTLHDKRRDTYEKKGKKSKNVNHNYDGFYRNIGSSSKEELIQEYNTKTNFQNRRKIGYNPIKDDLRRHYDDNNEIHSGEGYHNSQLFKLLNKQNVLIEKIANHLLNDEIKKKRIARTDFQDIVNSVEAKHNKTTTTVPAVTTTTKLSTIITLIDETEIREALEKDPFVRRILKLANRKRLEYEKQIGQ